MLRWFHLIFGLLVFVLFLITGQMMYAYHPEKELMGAELRLLMRSRHIYILLSALAHILLGIYLRMRDRKWRRWVQIAGSSFLTAASLVLIWAFFTESFHTQKFSDLSRLGLYLSLAGTIFHVIGGFLLKSEDR